MHLPQGTTTTTTTVTVAPARLPATTPVGGHFGAMGEAPQASLYRLDYTFPTSEEEKSRHDGVARTISEMALPSPMSIGVTGDARFMASEDSCSTIVLGIPSKYLLEHVVAKATTRTGSANIMIDAEVTSASAMKLMAQSTPTQSFETRIRDGSTLTAGEGLPTMSIASPRFKQSSDPLPDMPVWVLGILAGLFSFAFVAAIILFLVNFPDSLDFLKKLRRHRVVLRPAGHQAHHDHRRGDRELNGSNTATFASSTSSSGGARKRKARHLSVDTSAQYRGLGIAVPGSANLPTSTSRPALSRRRSYDEEALQVPTSGLPGGGPRSAAAAAWHAVTAPLPAISAFSPRPPSSDLETGTYHHRRLTRAHSEEMFSSGLYDTAAELEDIQQQHVSWVGRLGDRMEVAAQKLARLMHDQVQEGREEEGLLLPIRKGQRDRIMVRGSGASAG